MSRNWLYLLAVLLLPLLRLLVNELHYDEWLRGAHHDHAADFIVMLRNNEQFQEFIGGYVFPVFLMMVLGYWLIQEDKSRMAVQFLLLPLAYIPISIVGFTLVHAEFLVSYLYVNTILILSFGYIYVGVWFAVVACFEKLKLVE